MSSNPTPEEIIKLAESTGFVHRRPEVSATLFFIEKDPSPGSSAILINIYYTTRSIMTQLNHPSSRGMNELWRSNAYENLDELRQFFLNPRTHTGKGYREASQAVRGCVQCGEMKKRIEFSKNQWIKGPDANRCIECVSGGKRQDKMKELETALAKSSLLDSTSVLTEDLLTKHNIENGQKEQKPKQVEMERRQFNCPACPEHGRGEYIFFKQVPRMKPIVKCPQCKRVTRGRCQRLYPVPKDAEKGYGFYKCLQCGDKWGSSRAVGQTGMECHACLKKTGQSIMIPPFRLEKPRFKKKRRNMRRIPKEPIKEDQSHDRTYGSTDQQRNENAGYNALAGGVGGSGVGDASSYRYEPRQALTDIAADVPRTATPMSSGNPRKPKNFQHKCAACGTGACRNRQIPQSQIHDISDGNTVSTRSSIVTNSSVDKGDFVDRDDDFSGF